MTNEGAMCVVRYVWRWAEGGQREREESEYLIITRQTINEKEDEVINDFDA